MDEITKKHGVDPQVMREIGSRVREIRTRTEHSMESFAAMIDSTSATISNIENGKSVPSGAILMKISKAYSVSADWILHGETKEQEHLKEAARTTIFFRGKWQIFSHLNSGYMSEDDKQIHDAVFSLLESIQQFSEEEIALLRAVAEKFEKK
jgi:transcriptional regulator with XRE-family HTH domain